MEMSGVSRLSHAVSAGVVQPLPVYPTPLIGRQVELTLAVEQLRRPEVRLLTVTGPPGVGKTRLALHVAAELADDYKDGAVFVNLAALTNSELVVPMIAQTLGVGEVPRQPLLERLAEHLANKSQLIVLDNFEQVIDAAAHVRDLLAGAIGLKILVTSRESLQLVWEQQLPLPPLRMPDLAQLPGPQELAQFPSVALFVARARAVDPGFSLTGEIAPVVAEICVRLDGLPLAIELAAARTKVLPPQVILERLRHRLSTLTHSARDIPERHRTLRGAIGWSYGLLQQSEQALFRRLGVFSGGATLQAAESVHEKVPGSDLIDELASLVNKSLVQRDTPAGAEARFRMLETIREFALEQLEATGELDNVQRRHASFFLGLAEQADPEFHGPDQFAWLDRIEREHDNLRAALRWLVACDDPDLVLRLTTALSWFWEIRGYWNEGRAWMDAALARGDQSPGTRARTLAVTGLLASTQDDTEHAESRSIESLSIARASGDKSTVGFALLTLGILAHAQVRHEEATARFGESFALFEEAGPPWAAALAGIRLGTQARILGDYAGATSLLERSLKQSKARGDAWSTARALGELGKAARHQGDYSRARALLEESLQIWRLSKHNQMIAADLWSLGNVAMLQDDYIQARSLFTDALRLNKPLGNKSGISECLEGLARVAVAEKQWDRAATLFGAAEALREAISYWAEPPDRPEYESAVRMIRDSVPEDDFAASWVKGRAMPFDLALEHAFAGERVASGQALPSPPLSQLTKREDEVAALVAEGLTNREIAKRLFVSEETAATHVKHILRKLDLRSRAQIATWAVERRLRLN